MTLSVTIRTGDFPAEVRTLPHGFIEPLELAELELLCMVEPETEMAVAVFDAAGFVIRERDDFDEAMIAQCMGEAA
ncbi:MAG: hypothetical protein AAF707_00120 [Pseudomonadota bacterium]